MKSQRKPRKLPADGTPSGETIGMWTDDKEIHMMLKLANDGKGGLRIPDKLRGLFSRRREQKDIPALKCETRKP